MAVPTMAGFGCTCYGCTCYACTYHRRLLQEQHGMAPAQLARVVATMRRRGVRRENVRPPAALSLTLTLILTLTLTLTC